jgi:hypothetical protein
VQRHQRPLDTALEYGLQVSRDFIGQDGASVVPRASSNFGRSLSICASHSPRAIGVAEFALMGLQTLLTDTPHAQAHAVLMQCNITCIKIDRDKMLSPRAIAPPFSSGTAMQALSAVRFLS